MRTLVTVVEQVYFQQVPGGNPREFPSRYDRWSESELQPVERTLTVDGTLTLDFAWIDRPSMVLIRNMGQERYTIPTPEERKQIEESIVDVGDLAELRPGCSMRFTPRGVVQLTSRNGHRCRVTVVILP